jgi:hypothetical protein
VRRASVVLVAVIALGACAAPRNTLGTADSPCFRALPTAKAALHHQGRLVGVRRVSRGRLATLFSVDPPPGKEFCLVAFSGSFRPDQVERPASRDPGRYAAVVVTLRGTQALQTFLVDRLPMHLKRR